ncbi:MAG: hypothetical protein ACO3JL_11635 [Myxococcota bacterium]
MGRNESEHPGRRATAPGQREVEATAEEGHSAAGASPWRAELWQRGSALLEERRQEAVTWCDGMVKALGTGAMVLEAEDFPWTADWVRACERRLQQAQREVIARPLEESLGDARALTLRAPALALGGAFTLGFIVARFLRSSSQRAATEACSDDAQGYIEDEQGCDASAAGEHSATT